MAPVGPPTPRQRAWLALAAELTPAKSLQRLDTATARVVSTVGVIATLLTGFGLVAAGQANLGPAARALAAVSVGLAFLAVLLALAAQRLTITRRLNTSNLVEVERWYTRRFDRRAPLTSAATVLLALAAALAGAAAILALATASDRPMFAVTRTAELLGTPSTVTVEFTFRRLDAGQVASATVTADGVVVAEASVTPGPDGTATRTLTVAHVPGGALVVVDAHAADWTCTATLAPVKAAETGCRSA